MTFCFASFLVFVVTIQRKGMAGYQASNKA